MERVTLSVGKREMLGKGGARSLRRNGIIPAILYKGGSSLPVQISGRELSQFISKTAGEQVIVDLQFPDGTKQAIVKDYQVDPVMGNLLHVDFQEVSATEAIRVTVHVVIKGEAIGVKRDKGVLQYGLREIEIECLPDKIPGHIDVDVSNLGIGQSIHVRDLKLPGDIKVLTDPDEVLATVIAVKEEVAAVAVPAEAVEPEVIKKGKKEEEK
ncbi:50S ribosomal protein L25 [Dissulfurispira thermophila]|uniref:Large ribosomal subunit protein bL25 n=1 Tax=Dissulfurispira thermophila TaxID=2715679 RepID=A0A7G1H0Q5_9BACT|nr:50S ribosomal protein L25 [Dissulfurispira thermophila]BCB96375.1 50S ribosomal protein L25 [Dissulfurispira thermophila]